MKLVEFRKKMRKQFYYKKFAWRMLIIATTAFFTWSAIYSQMNRIARKQFENVQLYNNGAVFVMDFLQYNNMIHNDMIKNGTIDKEAYNKFVAETFIEVHSAEDYKIMPASVKGKSQELQESGYAMWHQISLMENLSQEDGLRERLMKL